jgi:hypothetical protein
VFRLRVLDCAFGNSSEEGMDCVKTALPLGFKKNSAIFRSGALIAAGELTSRARLISRKRRSTPQAQEQFRTDGQAQTDPRGQFDLEVGERTTGKAMPRPRAAHHVACRGILESVANLVHPPHTASVVDSTAETRKVVGPGRSYLAREKPVGICWPHAPIV